MSASAGYRIARRQAIKTLGAGAAALSMPSILSGAYAQTGDLAGQTVKIGTWGGSWRDALEKHIGSKLAARGAKVEYVIDTPSGNVAKLVAARGRDAPFDGFETAPELLPPLAKANMVMKLDYAKMPNSKALPAFARGDYHVVTGATLDGIVYNEAKFKELGIEPPKHYSELDNPKLKGRVAFPDIAHSQHYNAVLGVALEAGGDEASMAKAIPVINKIAPAQFYNASVDLGNKFSSGEVWAAPWHAGWAVRLKRTGVPVAMSYQKFGAKFGAMLPVYYSVSASTKSQAGALAFADTYLSPDVQFEFGKFTGSVPMDPAARAKMAQDPESKGFLMFSDAELNNAKEVDFSKIDLAAWREAWTRDIKR
ncbi:MAG: extracellular solute-binding protein [Alphaproteobacteria bacterium]|nr:extracellular solute-binding protein [Alphaproteobacteria bacterium]